MRRLLRLYCVARRSHIRGCRPLLICYAPRALSKRKILEKSRTLFLLNLNRKNYLKNTVPMFVLLGQNSTKNLAKNVLSPYENLTCVFFFFYRIFL